MRAVLVGLVGAALAGEALGAELIRNPCHNDLCTWFSIEDRRLVGTSLDGALFKVTLRRWRSVHPGETYARTSPRGGGESEVAHFLCSESRPTALHWDQSVGWRSIGPVALTAPNERSEPAANEYLAVCHGVHTDQSDGFSSIARRFGYSFYQDKQREGVLQSPEEVLTGPTAPPISGAQASTDDEIKAALGQKTWPGRQPVRVR